MILQTTDNDGLNTPAGQNEKNQDTFDGAGGGASGGETDRSIEHLSMAFKLAKPTKESDFVFSGADFLTSKAKKVFIYLQKSFTKALILKDFDLKCYIRIETNALGYAIDGVLC